MQFMYQNKSWGNYTNTGFPNRKYCSAQQYLGNPIWKARVLQSTSKMGKVTSPIGKAILLPPFAKEVMLYIALVCLFVCLWTTFLKMVMNGLG